MPQPNSSHASQKMYSHFTKCLGILNPRLIVYGALLVWELCPFMDRGILLNWDKLFSHAPCKVSGIIANMLIKSWKSNCALLIWNGRRRYTGNSLSHENIHWSFLFRECLAKLLGIHSRYFYNKRVRMIQDI